MLTWLPIGSLDGSHMGINRMYRRMKLYVWWPKMRECIREYVGCCLICKRSGPCRYHTLRSVLGKPVPFQLVSCDHVGHRMVHGNKYYYLVMIDHCSRLCMTVPMREEPTSVNAASMFRLHWFCQFGAPGAVLADRGVFTGKAFTEFVTQEMLAHIVFSSSSYPQGNGVNEAVHKGLEAAIMARMQYDSSSSFEDMLMHATQAYNATPHSSIGMAPFFALFGMAMPMPGWQWCVESVTTEEQRRAGLMERRQIAMVRASMLADRELCLERASQFVVGDFVVYSLSEYEIGVVSKGEDGHKVSYSSRWSLPQQVIKVQDKCLVVKSCIGEAGGSRERNVPVVRCRKLSSTIPPTLRKMAVESLEVAAPSYGTRFVHKLAKGSKPVTKEKEVQEKKRTIVPTE
eukprot:GHVS01041476.1.p1 GENE.GHVS01041476.1~~GHVS01041476.1.p1  ORF type:complete len:401 (+),score=19.57 GHVS01041476.1:315-1517(+)